MLGERKGCGTVKVDKQCFMVMPFYSFDIAGE